MPELLQDKAQCQCLKVTPAFLFIRPGHDVKPPLLHLQFLEHYPMQRRSKLITRRAIGYGRPLHEARVSYGLSYLIILPVISASEETEVKK